MVDKPVTLYLSIEETKVLKFLIKDAIGILTKEQYLTGKDMMPQISEMVKTLEEVRIQLADALKNEGSGCPSL